MDDDGWMLSRDALELVGDKVGYQAAADRLVKRAAHDLLDCRAEKYVWFDTASNQEEDTQSDRIVSKMLWRGDRRVAEHTARLTSTAR